MTGWQNYPLATPNGNAGWGAPVTKPEETPAPPPTPANPQGRIRLQNLSDVAKEIRKLYREARAGKLAIADATKLTYLLNMLAGILTASDLEARLAALEGGKVKS